MSSQPAKLTPADFRAAEKSTILNEHTYKYYHFLPNGPITETIFLMCVHIILSVLPNLILSFLITGIGLPNFRKDVH